MTSFFICINAVDDKMILQRDLLQFGHPQGVAGVTGHAPVAARRKGYRTDLGTVWQAAAFELLRKEAAIEIFQPVQQYLGIVFPGKSGARQMIDLCGAKPKT